jgi:dolichol-phosphate mannosyltransferase
LDKLKSSIICCYYNEINLIQTKLISFIDFIKKEKLDTEIIIVDNNSNDGTTKFLTELSQNKDYQDIKYIFNTSNLGKGGSIKKACAIASGKLACIFDIDEYSYVDLLSGISYFDNHNIDLLIGSRILKNKKFLYKKNLYGVIALTSLINKLFNLNLTDSAGATKIFKLDSYNLTTIHTSGFNFEFELICKFARKNFIINEYPNDYNPRTYAQGKKISPLKDGTKILITIIKSYFI